MNIQQIKKELDCRVVKAKLILNDEKEMDHFLDQLENKLITVPVVGEELAEIPTLIHLLKDHKDKKYVGFPLGGLIAVIAALLYLIAALDVVPDTIPLIGYFDDIAVIKYALKFIHNDLNDYKIWKSEQEEKSILETGKENYLE